MTNVQTNDRRTWIILALIVLLAGLVRFGLLGVPLERDEGEYAYAGQLLLEGIPPYQEAYNMKLPGVYASYAVLLSLFGQSLHGIRLGLMLVNGLTTVVLFLLARQLFRPAGALAAAAGFALLSLGQPVLGAYANAEHFVLLFALPGLLLVLRAPAPAGYGRMAAAGALLGAAMLMKQHGLAFLAAAVLFVAAGPLRERRGARRDDVLRTASLLGGAAAVYGIVCLVLAASGVFDRFWFWTLTYAREYVAARSLADAWPDLSRNISSLLGSAPLLWVLAGLGVPGMFLARGPAQGGRLFLLLFAALSAAAVVPGFYFRPHYFLLLLPAASLLAGAAVDALDERLGMLVPRTVRFGLPLLLMLAVIGQALFLQRDYLFRMTTFQSSRSSYWINPFPESLEIADYLRQRTDEHDRVAILGSEPQILFYAHRRSASGHIYMYPLMDDNAFALQLQREFIAEVEGRAPKFLLYVNVPTSWLRFSRSPRDVFAWFDAYQKEHLKLVGVVELYDDRSVSHWDRQVVWPVASPYWIAVFERRGIATPSRGTGKRGDQP